MPRPIARVPNAQNAIVDERKITTYLLSDVHPVGHTKAAFFRRLGFRPSAWKTMRDALLNHVQSGEVASATETDFGTKYAVDGVLAAPDGRSPRIRTVWFVAQGEVAPRLVTAYPAPGGDA